MRIDLVYQKDIDTQISNLIDNSFDFKSQPGAELILTPTGWKIISNIKVGDIVIGGDGKETNILNKINLGTQQTYIVKFNDRSELLCSDKNYFKFGKTSEQISRGYLRNITIKKMLETGLVRSNNKKRFFVPFLKEIEFEKKNLPINPYLMGALLSSGSFTKHKIRFHGSEEQVKVFNKFLNKPQYLIKIKNKRYELNCFSDVFLMKRKLSEFGLVGIKTSEKFIPKIYLSSSIKQRTLLLQGLMDNSGESLANKKIKQFNTVSKQLSDDFVELVNSLGGTVFQTESKRFDSKSNKEYSPDYQTVINLPYHIAYVTIPSKLNAVRLDRNPPQRNIIDITKHKELECFGLRINNKGNNYITNNYIVV